MARAQWLSHTWPALWRGFIGQFACWLHFAKEFLIVQQSRFNYNVVMYVACNGDTCVCVCCIQKHKRKQYEYKYAFNPSIAQSKVFPAEQLSNWLFFCARANCDTLDQSIMGFRSARSLFNASIALPLTDMPRPSLSIHTHTLVLQWQLSYNRSTACAFVRLVSCPHRMELR